MIFVENNYDGDSDPPGSPPRRWEDASLEEQKDGGKGCRGEDGWWLTISEVGDGDDGDDDGSDDVDDDGSEVDDDDGSLIQARVLDAARMRAWRSRMTEEKAAQVRIVIIDDYWWWLVMIE